jgi:hypothetical protein
MSEPYPWGSQAPTKRVSALEANIVSNDTKKADAIRRHREEIRKLDDIDKGLKSDLRAAQTIVDKEKADADAAAATRVLMKLLSSTGMDVGEAVRTGALEKAMADAFSKVSAKPGRTAASKEPSDDKGGEAS